MVDRRYSLAVRYRVGSREHRAFDRNAFHGGINELDRYTYRCADSFGFGGGDNRNSKEKETRLWRLL